MEPLPFPLFMVRPQAPRTLTHPTTLPLQFLNNTWLNLLSFTIHSLRSLLPILISSSSKTISSSNYNFNDQNISLPCSRKQILEAQSPPLPSPFNFPLSPSLSFSLFSFSLFSLSLSLTFSLLLSFFFQLLHRTSGRGSCSSLYFLL